MVKSNNKGRWTTAEHSRFLSARKNSKRWEDVASIVGTRTADQCRSHNQKMKLASFRLSDCSRMVDKETQYEAPVNYYANKPVFQTTYADEGSTGDSDNCFEDLDFKPLESIEDLDIDIIVQNYN